MYFPNYKVILSFDAVVIEDRPGCVHKPMCTCVCVSVCLLCVYEHTCALMHSWCVCVPSWCMSVQAWVCLWRVGACVHILLCMHGCLLCVQVYMCACTYTNSYGDGCACYARLLASNLAGEHYDTV